MLLSGDLKPGLILQERRLASILNVSRTPLRDALGQLVVKGLVTRQAGRFTTLDPLNIQRLVEAFNLRRLLEAEFAALAAGRSPATTLSETLRVSDLALNKRSKITSADYWHVDDAFHTAIAQAAGNEIAASLGLDVRQQTHILVIPRDLNEVQQGIREHLAILDAIMSGDAALSRQLMSDHIAHEEAAALSKALSES